MRVLTGDRIDRWTRGVGMMALAVLAWAVFVPGGVFWTAVLAAGLIGSAVVTAALMRPRPIPSLTRVIASAEELEPRGPSRSANTSGARLRSRGEGKP